MELFRVSFAFVNVFFFMYHFISMVVDASRDKFGMAFVSFVVWVLNLSVALFVFTDVANMSIVDMIVWGLTNHA